MGRASGQRSTARRGCELNRGTLLVVRSTARGLAIVQCWETSSLLTPGPESECMNRGTRRRRSSSAALERLCHRTGRQGGQREASEGPHLGRNRSSRSRGRAQGEHAVSGGPRRKRTPHDFRSLSKAPLLPSDPSVSLSFDSATLLVTPHPR
jgi:hypothetical protein